MNLTQRMPPPSQTTNPVKTCPPSEIPVELPPDQEKKIFRSAKEKPVQIEATVGRKNMQVA